MKHLILCLFVFSVCSCVNNPNATKIDIPSIGQEPTVNDLKEFIQDIQKLYAPPVDSRGNGEELSPARQFSLDIEKYKLTVCDYYRIDLERFYANPSEENLENCMSPREDKYYIIVWEDGIPKFRVLAQRSEELNSWTLSNIMPDFNRIISWLIDASKKDDLKDIRIFSDGSPRDFVSYDKDGKTYYFKITGEPYTPAKLTEFYVEAYKRQLANKTYIEKVLKSDKHL